MTISWDFDCKPKEKGATPFTASIRRKTCKKTNLSNYIPTEIKIPKVGWDDSNAKEGWCDKCKAIIPVPGRIYGYAGPTCTCGWAGKKIEDFTRQELIELLNQNS